jgi:hypothetical protein
VLRITIHDSDHPVAELALDSMGRGGVGTIHAMEAGGPSDELVAAVGHARAARGVNAQPSAQDGGPPPRLSP